MELSLWRFMATDIRMGRSIFRTTLKESFFCTLLEFLISTKETFFEVVPVKLFTFTFKKK